MALIINPGTGAAAARSGFNFNSIQSIRDGGGAGGGGGQYI